MVQASRTRFKDDILYSCLEASAEQWPSVVLAHLSRWLFFIEGCLTCSVATVAFYIVPDFPGTPTSWLTLEEQILAQKRMEEDASGVRPELSKSSQASGLVKALTDWTVWWLAVALAVLNASMSFLSFFPTLVATMGYSSTITLLLCTPPSILAFVTAIIVVRHSDMTRDRFWHIAASMLPGIVGFVSASLTMNNTIRYISL
ncbi:hypothetical protein ID866_5138 [Astraeus odoratus]|nr:hypothetical protein ID866_5138 [Astraeus odoratus]